MIKTLLLFLAALCLVAAKQASAELTFSFDSVDFGSNEVHTNAGGPEIEPEFDPDTDPQSRDFEIGGGVTMNLSWDWPKSDSGHWPARYDIVVDDRYFNPGPDGLGETADDLGITLRLQNGSATDAGAPPHEGSTGVGNSYTGIYTFTFSEPVFISGWDAGGLDYGGTRAEHMKVDVYSDLAQTTLVAADSITNITWHEGNEAVDNLEGALIDDSIADGDGYHAMATRSGNDHESVFRFDFTSTPVRVIVMEFYATTGAPTNYRHGSDAVANDGLVIDLTQNPGASDPDNVTLDLEAYNPNSPHFESDPDSNASTNNPLIDTRGRSAHFGIVNFTPCGLDINSLIASNYRLSGGQWVYDLAADLNYVLAPETTLSANGVTATIAGAVGDSATETVNFIGVLASDTVTIKFNSATNPNKQATALVVAPAAVACDELDGDVGGTVFRDYNSDGVQGANEPGYGEPGMYVLAYDTNNLVAESTPISADGSYVLPGLTLPVRLEFKGLPDWAQGGASGANSGSPVQFISAATCQADFAMQNPAEVCEDNPLIAVPCYLDGDPTPATGSGTSGAGEWLVLFRHDNSGQKVDGGYIAPEVMVDGTVIGATWGTAYHSRTGNVVAGALMKRHSGFGIGGPGAIYQITSAGVATEFLDLNDYPGIDAGSDTRDGSANNSLNADFGSPSRDLDAFAAVGKVGLGDIDFSDDGKTLYAVNLNDRTLLEIPVGDSMTAPAIGPGAITAHDLVAAFTGLYPDASAVDLRPWAIDCHDGLLYLGAVDSAETDPWNAPPHAYVISFDPANPSAGFSKVLDRALDYTREAAFEDDNASEVNELDGAWNAWAVDWSTVQINGWRGAAHPQPILSDIEIDIDGSVIIGLMDRFGLQSGVANYRADTSNTLTYQGVAAGDTLRFCWSGTDYVKEGDAGCDYNVFIFEGNAPNEFYAFDEFYQGTGVQHGHAEISLGSLALMPGTGNLIAAIYDPFEIKSGGVAHWSNTDSSVDHAYELYDEASSLTGGAVGKAVGLGDLELVCGPAAIIVGNRLWADSNANGVQDPGEPGIPNVTITLECGGTTVTTVTASDDLSTPWDEAGAYYFSSADVGTPLDYNEACTISIDLDDPDLGVLGVITPGTSATNDEHDNDASSAGVVAFSTGAPGENDYSFDIGVVGYDYGDLPSGGLKDFPTAGSDPNERARHQLGRGITLGSTVDGEVNGQPSVGSDGDGADEDGFPRFPDMMPGETYTIPFVAGVPSIVTEDVFLNAWIDFDCDAIFEFGEQIAIDLVVGNGINMLTFTVPDDAIPGLAYSRFRLSTESGLVATGDASDGEVEDYLVTILTPDGAIGNFVWLDEDSDGQQNPGETGIPNITVVLYLDADGAGGDDPVEEARTETDTDGRYLFDGLPAGCYYVDVLDSSVPLTLSQTTGYTNPGGDFGNKNHSGDGFKIDLAANEADLSADFGYNYNPTADVDGGTGDASIGDKVWFDVDQDGRKDANEVGIADVSINLLSAGPDGLFNTADDVLETTRTTDLNGCYIFEEIPPNAYIVMITDISNRLVGLTQTGDPDHFGTTGSNNDGKTTTPIVVGPGDTFLNADFGFYGDTNTFGRIGDKIWLDADASGGDELTKLAEEGIPGVTVALISDIDKDGVWEDGEPVIATDTTDSSGCYLFEGLPVDADGENYIVWVNDTENVLAGFAQSYDEDGGLDGFSTAYLDTDLVIESLTEDFSYTPRSPYGSIGDTIWLDLDSSGDNQESKGGEPGINNVPVVLCDSDGNTIATTATDVNGNYLFSNLPFGSYVVKVDTSSLAGAFINPLPSYDPDGGVLNQSAVTIDASAPSNRDQDFSYPPSAGNLLASIGDKVYYDYDGSGAQNGGEPGIYGVTVQLTPPAGVDLGAGPGNPITTKTDAKGCYLFVDLPSDAAAYTVTVLNPPAGMTQTQDPQGPVDNSSQEVLADSEHNRVQDFGYQPASTLYSIGDTVWFDQDSDGVEADDPNEGGGESGIPGVRVTLCNDGVDGTLGSTDDEIVAVTYTNSAGLYLFTGLPTDNYRVKVDTATLPEGVSPRSTFERDGTSDNYSDVLALASDVTTEDFAYPPLGAIGDTVFLDVDDDDFPDPNEGLSGVLVRLCDISGTVLLDETVTDHNGRYLFDKLPAGDYMVKVDPNGDTLPTGSVNTEDPDNDPDTHASPGDGESVVALQAGEFNEWQDFGYQGLLQIGNLVWIDTDADGVYEPAAFEAVIGGVTVDLYLDRNGDGVRDSGDSLVATTVTDSFADPMWGFNGNYLFRNLPEGDYLVEVSDRDGVLNGYWHSLGNADTDSHSQQEVYAIELPVSTNPEGADFGYYLDPACVGNYVWFDADDDGIQGGGEEGIDGVKLTLTITYPNSDTIVLNTLTGDDPSTTGVTEQGWYNFCNLLIDEDYRGAGGAGEPVYNITIDALNRFPGKVDEGGSTDINDSDQHSGVAASPVQGSMSTVSGESAPIASYDFAFTNKPDSYAEFQNGYSTLLGLDDNDTPGVEGGANNTANDLADGSDNPDGDLYDNALEYALCDHPGSGVNAKPFCVDQLSGTIDATFSRASPAPSDVIYTLEVAPAISSPPAWIDSNVTPTIVDNLDGSETLTYPNLEAQNTNGIARLKVTLGGVDYFTPVFGWSTVSSEAEECETVSNPYAPKEIFSGTIDDGSTAVLDLSTSAGSADISAQMAARPHYIEIVSGTCAGHRFDVASANADSITLDTTSARNTLDPIPDLTGEQIALRVHNVLDDLVTAQDFVFGSPNEANNDNPLTASRVLFFDSVNGWGTYFAYDDTGTLVPAIWTSADNSGLENVGNAVLSGDPDDMLVIVEPCAGFFVHNKARVQNLLMVGIVREWDFACPLNAGYNFVGSGYPEDQSPNDRNMSDTYFLGTTDPSTADQVEFWMNDGPGIGVDAYDSHFRVDCGDYMHWTTQENSSLATEDAIEMFERQRAAFINSRNGHAKTKAGAWTWPVPWDPDAP